MHMLWWAIIISSSLELVLWPIATRRSVRSIGVIICSTLIAFSCSWLITQYFGIGSILLGLVAIYRFINLSRSLEASNTENVRRRSLLRTSLYLLIIEIFIMIAWFAVSKIAVNQLPIVTTISSLQLIFVALLFVSAIWSTYLSRPKIIKEFLTDKELPTISVAIPARNETIDLENCLEALLKSDYPKLEILVLDDCSQGRTAEIIRSYAHAGVRFIPGLPPADLWLAKNQAYEMLFNAATGDYILFAGVDIRFDINSIRRVMESIKDQNKAMINILPRRQGTPYFALLIQPMRYWWELVVPRFLLSQPPCLSSCWMIKRSVLKAMGGFKAVKQSVKPENYFARELQKRNLYSFIRSSSVYSISSTKGTLDQYQTAIRVRYPALHRRPELILLLTLGELSFLLGPFAVLIWAIFFGPTIVLLLSATTVALLLAIHLLIISLFNPAAMPLALFNFPVVAVTELFLINESMRRYEFGVVDWKGRNICIPVLQPIPRLPNLHKNT